MNVSHRQGDGPLFANVFHHAPIGMALVGLDGRFMSANPALSHIVGYDSEELMRLTFLDITHPDDIYQDVMNIDRLVAGQSDSYSMLKRYLHKDGHYVWIRLHVSSVFENGKKPAYFLAQIEDQSESHSRLEQIGNLHDQHELILNAVQEGILGIDQEGKATFLNRAGATMLGFNATELIGKNMHQALHHTREDGSPYSLEECPIERTMRDGMCRLVENELFWRKDGSSFPVEYWTTPMQQDEKIYGVVVMFRDRTERLRVEEQLRERDTVFKLITVHSQDILTYTAPDSTCLYISSAVRNLLGYEPEELIGTVISRLYHPDDLRLLLSQDFDQTGICTYRVLHKDGHYLWVESVFKQVRGQDGEIEMVVGIARDVTKRIEVERKLEEMREELSNILHMQQGITFTYKRIGDHFVYTMADGMLLRQLKTTSDHIVGKHPEDIMQIGGNPDVLMYYEKAWHGETVWYESCFNGVTYLISLQPILQDGQTIEVIGSGVDISERKKADDILLESEERYRQLVESSTETIAIIRDGQWAFINNSGLTLFQASDKHDIVGTPVADRLSETCIPPFFKRMEQIIRRGKPSPLVRQQWLTMNGSEVHTELIGIPISYLGTPAVQLLIRDISELKRNEEWMLHSEKLSAAGQLAAGIAHEIRNPLTAIKGFFKLMQTQGAKEQYFEILDEEFLRIETILSDLLVLAKPKEEAVTRCCLQKLLSHVVSLLGMQAILNNITIVEHWPSDPIWIMADEDQIKQVFINILKNAIEVMPKGGEIQLTVKPNHNRVYIQVIDQGVGIPSDQLSKIGQPFFSLKENGTGLGMMITFRIIEHHGGSIHFDSIEKKGTTVEVILPVIS